MHHVVMFDIDGTLIHAGGAGRRAIVRAFRDLFGVERARIDFSLAGLTDSAILRKVHAANRPDPAEFVRLRADLFARYIAGLKEEMGKPGEDGEKARVYPGVRALLEALAARADVTLALLTGNLEEGARTKLAPFDLNRFFPYGGFGSDSEVRAEIFQVLSARLPEAVRAARPRVTIVGDTPHDIQVAKTHGVGSIGVATGGHYTLADLEEAGAEHLFQDLAATDRVLDALSIV